MTATDVGQILVTLSRAAEMLAMSVKHFRRHVMPEIRLVRSGALRLVPVAELERWAELHQDR